MAEKGEYVLGQNICLKTTQVLGALETWCDEQFLWIDEVLAEAKKTMATESIQLLPKTPTKMKQLQQRLASRSDDEYCSSQRLSRTFANELFNNLQATESADFESFDLDHVLDRNSPEECLPCSYSLRPVPDGSCSTGRPSPDCTRTSFFPELRNRNSAICLPNLDESLLSDEYHKTKEFLPQVASEHKVRVVRKSRKSRNQRSVSFNHKQTSVGVQTSDGNVGEWQTEAARDRELVSTGTQTDDVIVITVNQQLRTSSDVTDNLFRSGHSSLLPSIRESDVHSASCDRDTDSGHMSDAEKLLSTPAESIDRDSEEQSECTNKQLFAMCESTVSVEVNSATDVQYIAPAAELVIEDGFQQSKAAVVRSKNSSALSQKMSSAERCQLSRWTTATRLNVLEENNKVRIGRQPETFFASLEQLDSHTALDAVDMSGVSLLSSYKESKLPLPSCRMPSLKSQTTSSVDRVNPDVILSSSSQSQSSTDTHCQPYDDLPLLNLSDASVPRPSSGTRSRVSKGSPHSRGSQPRLSVGRKSLTKRRSVALRDKCHPPTKISRPAAWLMSATKATRSKASERQTTHEKKVTINNSSLKLTSSKAAAISAVKNLSSVHRHHGVRSSNLSVSATPARLNSTNTRSKFQKLQSLFSPKSNSAAVNKSLMPPPQSPLIKKTAVQLPASSSVNSSAAGRGGIEALPMQQKAAPHTKQRAGDTTSSSSSLSRTHHHPSFMLQCLSPRRSSSLRALSKPTTNSQQQRTGRPPTQIRRSSSERQAGAMTQQMAAKRGLFHRLHDRLKVATHDTHDKQKNAAKKNLANMVPTQTQSKHKSHLAQLKSAAAHVNLPAMDNKHDLVQENRDNTSAELRTVSAVNTATTLAECILASQSQLATTALPEPSAIVTSPIQHEAEIQEGEEIQEEECNNYDISDLCSDDSTDDELDPKKRLPSWATETRLIATLLHFHTQPMDITQLFGRVLPPDLNAMFDVKRPRFDKRTSSANWEATPGIGLLHYANVAYAFR